MEYDMGQLLQIERFVIHLRAERRYSEHTVQGYEHDVRRFVVDTLIAAGTLPDRPLHRGAPCEQQEEQQAVENFDFRDVTPDDIRNWIVRLSEREKLSPSSVNRMTCSLRAMFRYLRKTGEVVKDPFLRIGFQKAPVRLPNYIPESKMEGVVAELEAESETDDFLLQRDSLVVLLFYSTGIRLAELAGIRLCDFSSDLRELKVHGKGNKERVVPVLNYTRTKIMEYLERINALNICLSGEKSLFLTKEGKPLSRTTIYRIVKEQLTAAGVQGKRSPHVLRHTFATHLLNDGADIREIQELLGHNTLSATQVYTHNSIAALKKAYEGAHPRARKNKK